MGNQITLVQEPIFRHHIIEIGKEVKQAIEAMNLENQIATDETIQSLKTNRATRNKQHAELKQQFKEAMAPVTDKVTELKTLFKENISEPFDEADKLSKKIIGSYEIKQIDEKTSEIKAFYNELCLSEEIDFVPFDKVELKVTLSASKKSLRDKCTEFIDRIKNDMAVIDTEQYKVEIMAEYRQTLDLSKSTLEVRRRKQAEKDEADRQQRLMVDARQSALLGLSFISDSLTNTMAFVSDKSIFIKLSDLETLDNAAWEARYAELKFNVDAYWEATKPKHQPQDVSPKPKELKKEDVLQAPTVVEPPKPKVEETLTACFKVTAPMAELQRLGAFLKENNYKYDNIPLSKIQ